MPLLLLHGKYNSSSLIQNVKLLASYVAGCTDRFMSELVGNSEDRYSRIVTQFLVLFQENIVFPK